jgi:hypothetical protein
MIEPHRLRVVFNRWFRICVLFDLDPLSALRDPVRALRYVASAPESALESFLTLTLQNPPELEQFPDEDDARLFASALFAAIAAVERRHLKSVKFPAAAVRETDGEAPGTARSVPAYASTRLPIQPI